jgi:hypothetical protein
VWWQLFGAIEYAGGHCICESNRSDDFISQGFDIPFPSLSPHIHVRYFQVQYSFFISSFKMILGSAFLGRFIES